MMVRLTAVSAALAALLAGALLSAVGTAAALGTVGGPVRREPRSVAFRTDLATAGALVAALGLALVLAGWGGLLADARGLAGMLEVAVCNRW